MIRHALRNLPERKVDCPGGGAWRIQNPAVGQSPSPYNWIEAPYSHLLHTVPPPDQSVIPAHIDTYKHSPILAGDSDLCTPHHLFQILQQFLGRKERAHKDHHARLEAPRYRR
ncbi:hypothetical protein D3C78_1637880 [compost metagenome]